MASIRSKSLDLSVVFFIVCMAAGLSPLQARAQSEYHWSDQFGNRSTVLNGTMIGSVSDLGAVFYNPGRLAQLDRPGFLLTAEAFEVNRVELEGGTGDNLELEQTNFRGAPSLVAGLFTLPFLPGHKFAYSFLTRRRSESDLLLTKVAFQDLIPLFPGEEVYLGTWESAANLDETWVGISWAHELSPSISVGVTTFGTYLGRKKRFELDVRAVPESGDPFVLLRSREYRFSSYGLLWKAGLAGDFDPVRVGLSITTPQITTFGDGTIRYEELLTGDSIGENSLTTVFREEGLPASSHSPFAVGGGFSWVGRRAVLHLSGEWYSGVSQYQIMAVDSVVSQSSGTISEYRVMDELDSVFNYGIGIEWELSESVSTYGSAASDASAAPENYFHPFDFDDKVSNSIAQADGFHLGAGASLETRWIDLTAGFSYNSTKEQLRNPLIATGSGPGVPLQVDSVLELERRRWRFMVGFSIPMVESARSDSGDL